MENPDKKFESNLQRQAVQNEPTRIGRHLRILEAEAAGCLTTFKGSACQARKSLRPGSAVWVVRGRQLLKCSPEQLRHASPREELLEALSEDTKVPWTYTSEWQSRLVRNSLRNRIRTKCPGPDRNLEALEETKRRGQPSERPRLQAPEAALSSGQCWLSTILPFRRKSGPRLSHLLD